MATYVDASTHRYASANVAPLSYVHAETNA
jgi:hypothetical protein